MDRCAVDATKESRIMATKAKPQKEQARRLARLKTELWGLALLTLGLCLFLALVSFSKTEGSNAARAINLIGPAGAKLADLTLHAVGLGAFFLDAALVFCGFSLLLGRRVRVSAMELSGYVLVVPVGAMLLDLLLDGQRILGHQAGGFVGELLSEIGRSLMGTAGTAIVALATLILAIALISETNPSSQAKRISTALVAGLRFLALGARRSALGVRRSLASSWRWFRRWIAGMELRRQSAPVSDAPPQAETTHEPSTWTDGPSELGQSGSGVDGREPSAGSPPKKTGRDASASGRPAPSAAAASREPANNVPITLPPAMERAASTKKKKKRAQFKLALDRKTSPSGFELPETSLLAAPKISSTRADHSALRGVAEQIEKGLAEFKIKGKITGITPGPVVTMYEYEPAPGVKLSAIANLSADLARVIRAASVRIVAPIPGKGVVGIEVPNVHREMVFLRELLEDEAFQDSRARLPIAIGKDIGGEPTVADLARMPHLLVAGATGSGKSVAVNTMVTSLLYRATPDEVRMIMVDPKMLELSIYEGIPHLLVPVVTDPNKAAAALKWAVDEMERRYYLLSQAKVRNLAGYNKEVERLESEAAAAPEGTEIEVPERIPYIVIIIDEFADLMMVASKDVEICVARLAQKARAAGVHLILATQRPDANVITGLIKANFPTRICFRVFDKLNSRVVLDAQGAENLLGMGDMLFRPPGRGDLVRVHGAFIDEKEIHRVVESLKAQGEPVYMEEILAGAPNDEGDDEDFDMVDEMYDRAIEIVTQSRKASISNLQRKLRVGYNRAARMIEMMEREGVVSGSDGRGGREVLAPPPPPM